MQNAFCTNLCRCAVNSFLNSKRGYAVCNDHFDNAFTALSISYIGIFFKSICLERNLHIYIGGTQTVLQWLHSIQPSVSSKSTPSFMLPHIGHLTSICPILILLISILHLRNDPPKHQNKHLFVLWVDYSTAKRTCQGQTVQKGRHVENFLNFILQQLS